MNMKVRIKNPVFWAQIAFAIVSPILVGLGMQWTDMTTWQAFGAALYNAICNPVIVVAIVGSVWTALNDPTTKGFGDSKQALTYTTPKNKEDK